jgi:hypothetical protein
VAGAAKEVAAGDVVSVAIPGDEGLAIRVVAAAEVAVIVIGEEVGGILRGGAFVIGGREDGEAVDGNDEAVLEVLEQEIAAEHHRGRGTFGINPGLAMSAVEIETVLMN